MLPGPGLAVYHLQYKKQIFIWWKSVGWAVNKAAIKIGSWPERLYVWATVDCKKIHIEDSGSVNWIYFVNLVIPQRRVCSIRMFSPCANEKLKVKESLAGPENKAKLLVFVQNI